MKIKYEDLVLTGEDAPKCYSVEDNQYMGFIVAKGTLKELLQTPEYLSLFGGTFGMDDYEDPELWPEDFNYVIVMEDMDDAQDGYRIYNYDCDPCGVYCIKSLYDRLEDEDITIEEILTQLQTVKGSNMGLLLNSDSAIRIWVIEETDFSELIGQAGIIENTDFYKSYHCGCEHDCCGHLSSRKLEIRNNNNGWVSIFLTQQYNY